MRAAASLSILVFIGAVWAQDPGPNVALDSEQDAETQQVYICPMDPEMRSHNPGNCPRCGMKLAAGLPEPVEYHLDLEVTPRPLKVSEPAHLAFTVRDPWKNQPVTNFQVMHEKLFHLFVVSQDLEVFVHQHPSLRAEGIFEYEYAFPKSGMYRVLGDFYPDGATPQLIVKTLFVPGPVPETAKLVRDYSAKDAENMRVTLLTVPQEPLAGLTTQMRFLVEPAGGLEQYLGAWGHMLTASDDLIDIVHEHPFIADGGPEIQFNVVFPRARTYRVWVQFQRNGVVNTARFDVPVKNLGL